MSTLPLLPRSIPDPEHSPLQAKTMTRWALFVGAVAAGEGIPASKLKYLITNGDIEAVTRADPTERQRFNEAVIAGRKSKLNILEIQEFCGRIAEGKTIDEAQMEVWGTIDSRLVEVIHMDEGLHAQYLRALESRSHVIFEPLLKVVADKSRDVLDNGKGGEIPNMAAVSRDKLIAETLIKVAGIYNRKDYGEQKQQTNVQVNLNYAERLEGARHRDKHRENRVTPKQMQSAVDAVFSEKTAEEWVDDKPTDTVWREET